MRAVEGAKIFTIHGGGGLPAPACPGAGWGRDKTEDPFNAASPPPPHCRRCRLSVPLFYFPFGRCQNTTLRRRRALLPLFHICRCGSSPTNTCFAAESNYGRQQLRLEEEEEEEATSLLMTMKIRGEAAKLMLLLIF